MKGDYDYSAAKKKCCGKSMVENKDWEFIIKKTIHRYFHCEECGQGATYIKIEGYDEM